MFQVRPVGILTSHIPGDYNASSILLDILLSGKSFQPDGECCKHDEPDEGGRTVSPGFSLAALASPRADCLCKVRAEHQACLNVMPNRSQT